MYRHFVFDIDGTILDTAYADTLALQETILSQTGVRHPLDVLHASLGQPSAPILRAFGVPEGEIPRLSQMWTERLQAQSEHIFPFPGMEETLRTLKAAGKQLGVVTSRDAQEYDQDFANYPLSTLFETAIRADDTQQHKPHPAPLLEYMARAGAKPVETIYIGDSIYDCQCAHAAGVDFALAAWGALRTDMDGVKYRLKSPEDLLQLI